MKMPELAVASLSTSGDSPEVDNDIYVCMHTRRPKKQQSYEAKQLDTAHMRQIMATGMYAMLHHNGPLLIGLLPAEHSSGTSVFCAC